jgi:hypothetical protein
MTAMKTVRKILKSFALKINTNQPAVAGIEQGDRMMKIMTYQETAAAGWKETFLQVGPDTRRFMVAPGVKLYCSPGSDVPKGAESFAGSALVTWYYTGAAAPVQYF